MSKRTAQISDELRRVIQEIIARGLSDPRIAGLITVTRVKVSEDLRSASVGISVFPAEKEALTMHGLRAASRHIRRRAGDMMAMNRVPELDFEVDPSVREQGDVLRAIARAREELDASGAPGAHEGAPVQNRDEARDPQDRSADDSPHLPGASAGEPSQ